MEGREYVELSSADVNAALGDSGFVSEVLKHRRLRLLASTQLSGKLRAV